MFKVFQKVKVKVSTTDSFPLKIVTQLLLTEDDMAEYDMILAEQNKQ